MLVNLGVRAPHGHGWWFSEGGMEKTELPNWSETGARDREGGI